MKRAPKAHIKRGDIVEVLSGDHAGQTGKVLQVMPEKGRAIVEGLNLIKKHMRKSQDNPKGGIVEKEAALAVAKLKLRTSGVPEKKAVEQTTGAS
ncbi:MAG: 50S ribosomal protein L24 [Kiritimatiellaeota bacterium]|nr:50S ribosomal protein L24 [Kiritimatiellota bacterium]